MPLRLRAHTQRRRKQQRKRHDQTYLQRAVSRHKEQNRRGSDKEGDGGEDEDETHDGVNAPFAAEVQVIVVGEVALFGGGEEFLWVGC